VLWDLLHRILARSRKCLKANLGNRTFSPPSHHLQAHQDSQNFITVNAEFLDTMIDIGFIVFSNNLFRLLPINSQDMKTRSAAEMFL
jgi:hypothetical protein